MAKNENLKFPTFVIYTQRTIKFVGRSDYERLSQPKIQ